MPGFEVPQECRTNLPPQYLQYFYKIQNDINNKIQKIDDLNHAYKDKMERHFLITFSKLMNKMSEDLLLAEQAYKNIDKQIATDQKCINLAEQINFFKGQCEFYKAQLQKAKRQIGILKERNMLLFKQKEALSQNNFKKVKECLYFKNKCKQYQKQYNISNQKQNTRYHKSLAGKKEQIKEDQNAQKQKLMAQIQKQIKNRKKINFTSLTSRNSPDHFQNQPIDSKNSRSKNHSSISKRLRETKAQSFFQQSSLELQKSKPSKRFDLKIIAKDLDFDTMKVNNQPYQTKREEAMTSHRMRSKRNSLKNSDKKSIQLQTIY